MDTVSRVIVLCALLLVAIAARAAEPVEWFYTPVLNPEQGMAKRTMEAACQSTAAIYNRNYQGVQRLDAARWYCGMSVSGVDGYVTMRCEDGSTPTPGGGPNGTCADPPPPPPTCTADSTLGTSSSKWYWKGKGSTTCQQGCLYIADQFAYDKESGYSVGWGRLNGLGATCTTGQESAGDNPPDNKPPNKCDPGKCTGTINGVAVCVKCGNGGSVDQKSETTTKDPDGEGGEPGETTSTKTDTKTTCDDGKCQTTTTTTTTNGDGTTKTETKTEDQSQDEFCAKNPDHALCKEEESKFEGGCQSGFRCEGDAVQCAMAREQHQRMCQLLDTETDLSTLGKRVGSGEDAADVRAQLGTGVAPVDVSGQLASATPLGPNSGCPADVSVGNWTIPFSRMCPHLNTLGNALIGLSWLVAALIVFRRAD